MRDVFVLFTMINSFRTTRKGLFCSIHMKNIQSITVKMIRVSRNISLAVMKDIFKQKENSRYNLRQISEFSRPLVKSVYDGSEIVLSLGPKIWNMLLDYYKDIDNLNTFKNKIKKWNPENCPSRFCKVYINITGFV